MVLQRAGGPEHEEVEALKNSEQIKKRFTDRNLASHIHLNFCLPHELGGIGDPIDQKYS
jgi:hypothetical protein